MVDQEAASADHDLGGLSTEQRGSTQRQGDRFGKHAAVEDEPAAGF